MIKNLIILLILIAVRTNLSSQTNFSDKEIIQLVADNIVKNTKYTITDKDNNETYQKTPYKGIEDLRLFNFRDTLYYLGTCYDIKTVSRRR